MQGFGCRDSEYDPHIPHILSISGDYRIERSRLKVKG